MAPSRSHYVISFLPGLVAMDVIQVFESDSNLLKNIPSLLKQLISPLLYPMANTWPSLNQLRLIGFWARFLVMAEIVLKFLS